MSEMRFFEAAERYGRKLSEKGRPPCPNRAGVLKRLKEFIGDKPLSEIDKMFVDDVHYYLACRKTKTGGTYAVGTIASHLSYLKALLNWAHEAGKLDKVPKIKVPKGAERDGFLEPFEVEALIRELDPWRSELVMFGVHTGLRKKSVSHLRWDQLEKDYWEVCIEGVETKNGKRFRAKLNSDARDVILRQLTKAQIRESRGIRRSEYVFVKENTNKPSVNACDKTWKKAVARAGLPEGTCFHTLRHTFASWHVRAEVSDLVIMKMGGWSNTAMLQRYAHIRSAQMEQAVKAFEGMVKVN